MKLVDLNVLLYATNADTPQHQTARRWWEGAVNGQEPIGLTWVVLLGFLRLSTHPRIFPKPLTPKQALERITRWTELPTCTLVREGSEHLRLLGQLIEDVGTTGNLTTDVHLAAIAIGNGATLVSFDHDFGRFPQLRWECPR
jgi:toxin-antitoxin system PIN domain toxin